jgi:hypothetical protein
MYAGLVDRVPTPFWKTKVGLWIRVLGCGAVVAVNLFAEFIPALEQSSWGRALWWALTTTAWLAFVVRAVRGLRTYPSGPRSTPA